MFRRPRSDLAPPEIVTSPSNTVEPLGWIVRSPLLPVQVAGDDKPSDAQVADELIVRLVVGGMGLGAAGGGMVMACGS